MNSLTSFKSNNRIWSELFFIFQLVVKLVYMTEIFDILNGFYTSMLGKMSLCFRLEDRIDKMG